MLEFKTLLAIINILNFSFPRGSQKCLVFMIKQVNFALKNNFLGVSRDYTKIHLKAVNYLK